MASPFADSPENHSSLAPSKFAGITMVKGDLLENRSLIGALHGVDGFFIVTTPFVAGWGQPPNIDSEVKAGFTALEAAEEAGTSHVVLSTVASAGFVHEPTGIGHFDSKVRIEEKARKLSVPMTIVRPSYFMENHLNPWSLQGIRGGAISMPVKPTTGSRWWRSVTSGRLWRGRSRIRRRGSAPEAGPCL